MQSVGVVAQPLHRRLQARHVAMMVGAPDVDQLGEFTLKLVAMIGDVGGEVSQLAVALDHRAVLVVAELGRAIPLGAVLGIKQAEGAQTRHRLGHFAALAHGLLAEEDIEANAELAKLPADGVQQANRRRIVERNLSPSPCPRAKTYRRRALSLRQPAL